MTKTTQENDMTDLTHATYAKTKTELSWSIVHVLFMSKMILNYHDQSDLVLLVKKTRLDNNVIDCTNAVSIENETKLPSLIKPGVVYEKSHIG